MTTYLEPVPDRARQLVGALGPQPRPAASLRALTELVRTDPAEQLVVLGPSVALNEALAFVAPLRLHHPTLGVVLVRDQFDVVMLADALRAGVREVVESRDVSGIAAACARSLEMSRHLRGTPDTASGGGGQGRVVTVFSGKGGCGKSTIATNLAAALSAGGARRALLVDLDLSFGDVAIMLQLIPKRSLVDAVAMAGRLDEMGLRSLLTPYRNGLETLLAPTGPADGDRVSRELITEALGVARGIFDYIVVDTPPVFSDQVLAALDLTDWYVVPATPDIQTLKNLQLTLDMFDQLEYSKEQRIVVLNRADTRVGLTAADIERVARGPVLTHLPSTKDVQASINKGVPLVAGSPAHPMSRAIRKLVDTRIAGPLVGAAAQSGVTGRPGRGGFLGRGRK